MTAGELTIWRAAGGFLVARGDGVFDLIDATGALVRRFEPRTWELDGGLLGCSEYAVTGDALVDRGTADAVALDGLRRDDTPDALRFVQTALADLAVQHEEQRIRAELAADARIAAIPGALEDLGCGAETARAQRALCDRIRRYADDLAAALLGTLVELARARIEPGVVERYTRACLLACFVPTRDVDDSVEAAPVAAPQLAAALRARIDDLERAADGQESVDANLNAARYRRAAHAVRDALRLVV